jgi:DNA-binding transcriptional regulator YiaG
MFVRAPACCELCGQAVARVDEHDRCEQCVLRAEALAAELLVRLEELVRRGLAAGLTEAQLRDAFELSLADEVGELSELSLSRHPAAGEERGTWQVDPQSAWLDSGSEALPNRIRRLRQEKAMSAESLAAMLGVSVSSLALWEHTAEVPQGVARRLAEILGVSVPHLMKTDVEWLRN